MFVCLFCLLYLGIFPKETTIDVGLDKNLIVTLIIFQVRVLTQILGVLVGLIKGNASVILFGCFTNVLRAVKFVLEELVSNTYM